MVDKTTKIVVTGDTSKYERSMQSAQTAHNKTIGTIRTGWLQITAAIYGAAKAYDAVKLGARAQQEALAFSNMAASHGMNADKMIQDLKRVSVGAVDTMTIVQKAGTAMMMGIDPEKISGLMAIARATAKMTGQTVVKAFEDITLATARESKKILDNLGILVSAGKANEEYAKKLNITGRELTDAEKKAAFLNAAIEKGGDLIIRLGGETQSASEKIQAMEADFRNLSIAMSQLFIPALEATAGVLVTAFDFYGKLFGGPQSGLAALQKQEKEILDTIRYIQAGVGVTIGGKYINPTDINAQTKALAGLALQLQNVRAAIKGDEAGGLAPKILGAGGAGGAVIPETSKSKALQWELEQTNIMYQAIFDTEVDWAAKTLEMKTQSMEAEKASKEIAMQWELEQTDMWYQAIFDSETDFAVRRIELTANAEEQIKSIKEQSAAYQWAVAEGLTTGLAAIAGAGAKEIFLITKGFEMSMAVMAAFAAYNLALANPPGPPWTLPIAEAAFARGMWNVAAIAATAFGQMARSSSGGGGGGLVGGGTYTSPVITAPAAAESKPALTIIIEGDFIGDESYIDNLVERINGAEDRDVFIRRTLYAREVE